MDEEIIEPIQKPKPVRRGDRRFTSRPRATINQILEWMESEADLNNQGDLLDNVLKIFNTLSTDDKRTYLRYSLNLLWEKRIELAQQGMSDIIVSDEIRIDPNAIKTELSQLDNVVSDENIRLRSFIIKTAFVLSISVFLAIFVWTFLYGRFNFTFGEEYFKHIYILFDVFMGGSGK